MLGCSISVGARCAFAQHQSLQLELIRKLQSEKTTDQARKQLLQFSKSDPSIRKYLITQLPPMIERGPDSCPPSDIADISARWHSCPWYNAVELAGNLKIAEAARTLAPWIAMNSYGGLVLGLSSEYRLDPYPAATALWQIGNPAIPSVQHVLASGPRRDRDLAIHVLCIVDTPEAKAVLRNFRSRESDQDLRMTIERCTT